MTPAPVQPVPLTRRRVLDEQVAATRSDPDWGVWPWLGPLLATVALIVGLRFVVDALPAASSLSAATRLTLAAALNIGPELGLLVVCLALARPIARRSGGWRATFGWGWVTRRDWAPFGLGLALVYAGRIVVNRVSEVATHGAGNDQASNLTLTHRPSAVGIVILVVAVAVVAPVTEELLFRGLVLRTFLRRWSFWPSAVASTAVFALIHVYEVSTVLGAVFLFAGVFVRGLANCYLVRITGRLAPGVMVHAAFNLLAVVVVVAQAR